MNKNTWLFLFLLTLLMFVWTVFFFPTPPAPREVTPDTISAPPEPKVTLPATPTLPPFLAQKDTQEKILTVETATLRWSFSSRGAQLRQAQLKNFLDAQKQPITLWDTHQKAAWQLAIGRYMVSSQVIFFTLVHAPAQPLTQVDSVVYRYDFAPDTFIEIRYRIRPTSYHVQQVLYTHNLKGILRNTYMGLESTFQVPQTEKSFDLMKPHCALFYRYGGDVESLDPSDKPEKKEIQGNIDWVSQKAHFFSVAWLAESEPFLGATLEIQPTATLPRYQTYLQLPWQDKKPYTFTWYVGPNDYQILKSYGLQLERQINLGWSFTRYINTLLVIPLFNFLERYIGNYGIIILLLAIFIKLLLSPLTYRSYLSMVKMQIVNEMPEVKALEEKYKDNPAKLNAEKMLFYQQAKISPLSGCIPMLLQLPILIAMFSFFPSSIELRQKRFLWADDLSTYDSILDFGFSIPFFGDHLSLFALLMTLSTILYTYISQQGQTTTMKEMRWISYIMPVIFFGILNNYSAALSYYYLVINLLTIGQTYLMKRLIDKEALIQKIEKVRAMRKKDPRYQRMAKWLKK
ncbi:MAG: membrane protein insertase YidC [Bacteroidia bacterium]